jgi:glycosyltransferase involved in cell wall biosynthesis
MMLIIGHDASLTGAPIVLLNFVKWLVHEKNEPVFIILKKGGPLLNSYKVLGNLYVWEIDLGEKPIFFRILNRIVDLRKLRKKRIVKKALQNQPSLILSNTIVNGDIIEMFESHDIPVINWVHELENVIQMFNKEKGSEKSLSLSSHIIAASNAVKENLMVSHNVPAEKISVFYEMVAGRNELPHTGNKSDFVVCGCGTLIYRKGFDLFLQVANIIVNKKEIKNIRFVWIGGDKDSYSYTEFKHELELLNLEPYVSITGETTDPFAYYSSMDLFLMTSREDPFPLVNIEAAQCGLPIICFDKSGGSPEFVTQDVGFVVDYLDVEAMAGRIMELKNNHEQCKILSENIKKKSELFTVETKAGELYDLLNRLKR